MHKMRIIDVAWTVVCLNLLIVSGARAGITARSLLTECHLYQQNVTLGASVKCVRDKSLSILDEITSAKTIFLTDAVQLVQRQDLGRASRLGAHLNDESELSWPSVVLRKFRNLLKTHVLQIELSKTSAARGRRRARKQMMPMMLFGITALGMILIPMGFQFLTLFAGKALLLSKLALMLASINGIKRLANSGINYGFYQAPPEPQFIHRSNPYFDRSDNNFPRMLKAQQ